MIIVLYYMHSSILEEQSQHQMKMECIADNCL